MGMIPVGYTPNRSSTNNPILVRDYALSKDLADTNIFRTIFDTNKQEDPYVTALKVSTGKPRKFKFGFEAPSNIAPALYLDRVNGYTGEDSWAYAIKKELAQLE
jgi:hypothetical protein